MFRKLQAGTQPLGFVVYECVKGDVCFVRNLCELHANTFSDILFQSTSIVLRNRWTHWTSIVVAFMLFLYVSAYTSSVTLPSKCLDHLILFHANWVFLGLINSIKEVFNIQVPSEEILLTICFLKTYLKFDRDSFLIKKIVSQFAYKRSYFCPFFCTSQKWQ